MIAQPPKITKSQLISQLPTKINQHGLTTYPRTSELITTFGYTFRLSPKHLSISPSIFYSHSHPIYQLQKQQCCHTIIKLLNESMGGACCECCTGLDKENEECVEGKSIKVSPTHGGEAVPENPENLEKADESVSPQHNQKDNLALPANPYDLGLSQSVVNSEFRYPSIRLTNPGPEPYVPEFQQPIPEETVNRDHAFWHRSYSIESKNPVVKGIQSNLQKPTLELDINKTSGNPPKKAPARAIVDINKSSHI